MSETWKRSPVRGDLYEVSDHGRVRNITNGRIRRLRPNTHGYLAVGMWVRGASRTVDVHRLTALAFLEETGPVVRHLDGNQLNNRADNLAFGSAAENVMDTIRHGRHVNANKTHCPQGHPYDEANTYWARDGRHCRPCNLAAVKRLKARRAVAR